VLGGSLSDKGYHSKKIKEEQITVAEQYSLRGYFVALLSLENTETPK